MPETRFEQEDVQNSVYPGSGLLQQYPSFVANRKAGQHNLPLKDRHHSLLLIYQYPPETFY